MVTKNQVDNLLKKNLTPKEVARLLIADMERVVRTSNSQTTSELSENLSFNDSERQKIKESQSQKERWKTSQWFEAHDVIGFDEYQAQVDGLEAIESLNLLTDKLQKLHFLKRLSLAENDKEIALPRVPYLVEFSFSPLIITLQAFKISSGKKN